MRKRGLIINRPIDVTAAIIRRNGKLLIARRHPGGPTGGLWEFPGGKIEGGEAAETCLARELHEELGIRAGIGRRIGASFHDYGDFEIRLIAYEASILSGTPRPKDHSEIRWVAPGDLHRYRFAPADLPFVERLSAGGEP